MQLKISIYISREGSQINGTCPSNNYDNKERDKLCNIMVQEGCHWTLYRHASVYVTCWAKTRKPEISIQMFSCAAVKNWKWSVAWFLSYRAKCIADTEHNFSKKCHVFMLMSPLSYLYIYIYIYMCYIKLTHVLVKGSLNFNKDSW